MKLEHISIQNFLSIEDMQLPIKDGRLVIVGENNVGKTNIFRAIQLAVNCKHVDLQNYALVKGLPTCITLRFQLDENVMTLLNDFLIFSLFQFDTTSQTKVPMHTTPTGFKDNFKILEIRVFNNGTGPTSNRFQLGNLVIAGKKLYLTNNQVAADYFNVNSQSNIFNESFKEGKIDMQEVNIIDQQYKADFFRLINPLKPYTQTEMIISFSDLIDFLVDRGIIAINTLSTFIENAKDIDDPTCKLFLLKNTSAENEDIFFTIREKFKEYFPNVKLNTKLDDAKNTVNLQFESNGLILDEYKVGSAMIETAHLLIALYHPDYQTILLDEPNKLMHKSHIDILRRQIFELTHTNKKSIITITHSTEMVKQSDSKSLVRIYKEEEISKPFILPPKADTIFSKWLFDPLRLQLFFSRGTIFVEGETETRLLQALGIHLSKNNGGALLWDVIALGSKTGYKNILELSKLWPFHKFVAIFDFDFLMEITVNKEKRDLNDAKEWKAAASGSFFNRNRKNQNPIDFTKYQPGEQDLVLKDVLAANDDLFVWEYQFKDIEEAIGIDKEKWKELDMDDLVALIDQWEHDNIRKRTYIALIDKLRRVNALTPLQTNTTNTNITKITILERSESFPILETLVKVFVILIFLYLLVTTMKICSVKLPSK